MSDDDEPQYLFPEPIPGKRYRLVPIGDSPMPPPDPAAPPARPAPAVSDAEGAACAALRSLACWLGVGGYNAPAVDAAELERKIRVGVDDLIRVETARARGPQISDDEEKALLRRQISDITARERQRAVGLCREEGEKERERERDNEACGYLHESDLHGYGVELCRRLADRIGGGEGRGGRKQ